MKLFSVAFFACCFSLITGQLFGGGRFDRFVCGSTGLVIKNGRCQDKNECDEKPFPCDEGEICINTRGSYRCIETTDPRTTDPCQPNPCRRNYRCVRRGSRHECQAVTTPPPADPCQPNPCPRGNYRCVRRGSRHECQDIDECRQRPSPCPRNSRCRNTPGSFNCQCNSGYQGPSCTAITTPRPADPCQPNPCPKGNYRCVRRGSRHDCQDIDECRQRPSPCPRNSRCRNTPGSFNCQCNTGYQGPTCTDINECLSNPCRRNERCLNTQGSFRCTRQTTCRTGYSGRPCKDIDECRQKPSPCPQNSRCRNTPGSFNCQCNTGYEGPACTAVEEDSMMCNGRPRKWGKCSTSYPEIRYTNDSCTQIMEECSPGKALAQQFMENVLMPAQEKPQLSRLGPRRGAARLEFKNVMPGPRRCTLMTERDRNGNIRKAKCEVPNSVSSLPRRGKRQVIQQTKRDLLIMLDESGSIDYDNFEKVKDIAAAIVELLCDQISLHPRRTRVAITTFDRRVTLPVRLLEGNDKDRNAAKLARFIRKNINFNYTSAHRTCLIDALEHAYFTALDSTTGGRRGDPRVEQDIILISDGCENCLPQSLVPQVINHVTNFFIQEGIHVYVIGISVNRSCQQTLALLAQGGRCFHFFYLDRWDYEVDDFLFELKNPPDDICLNVFESPFGECLDPISNRK